DAEPGQPPPQLGHDRVVGDEVLLVVTGSHQVGRGVEGPWRAGAPRPSFDGATDRSQLDCRRPLRRASGPPDPVRPEPQRGVGPTPPQGPQGEAQVDRQAGPDAAPALGCYTPQAGACSSRKRLTARQRSSTSQSNC